MRAPKFIHNLKLRSKLILLVLVPLGTLVALALADITRFGDIKTKDEQFSRLVELAVAAGQLTHEMQKERGASAALAQSADPRFKQKVAAQRCKRLRNGVLPV